MKFFMDHRKMKDCQHLILPAKILNFKFATLFQRNFTTIHKDLQ